MELSNRCSISDSMHPHEASRETRRSVKLPYVSGYLEAIWLLLDAGSCLVGVSETGIPLLHAAFQGDLTLVRFLLGIEANPTFRCGFVPRPLTFDRAMEGRPVAARGSRLSKLPVDTLTDYAQSPG
jgi:hypothetical protein